MRRFFEHARTGGEVEGTTHDYLQTKKRRNHEKTDALQKSGDYGGHGYSILEMMHRKPPFEEILLELKSRVKSLLAVPDDFEILFCPGGGKMQ